MHVLVIWRAAVVVTGARQRWSPIQFTGLHIKERNGGKGEGTRREWERKRERERQQEIFIYAHDNAYLQVTIYTHDPSCMCWSSGAAAMVTGARRRRTRIHGRAAAVVYKFESGVYISRNKTVNLIEHLFLPFLRICIYIHEHLFLPFLRICIYIYICSV